MKIIFLDVDGVLNCRGTKARCEGFTGIDKAKVALLKELVDATNAKIVLSSTWRLGYVKSYNGYYEMQHSRKYLERKLKAHNLSIYDVTPDNGKMGYRRPEEIYDWLSQRDDITNIVIMDDEDFSWSEYNMDKYWVESSYTDRNGGINQEHVDKAIHILNEVDYDIRTISRERNTKES